MEAKVRDTTGDVWLSGLLPGLGQWVRGERAAGGANLCAALGVLGGVALALWGPPVLRSKLSAVLLAFTYPFVWVPAVKAARRPPGTLAEGLVGGESIAYVLFLLFMIGPMALPLLWQSSRLSRSWKVALTVLVILVAVGAILLLLFLGPVIEGLLGALGTGA